MIKPTKVLCKRTQTSGKPYYWDMEANPPIRLEWDNRAFVAGNWYDVIYNEHDSWDEEKRTFTVIDNNGSPHLHFMYDENDKAKWPDICTKYGPRDYAKWFYTPEELIQLENGTFKLEEDINIKPGNSHWVKTHEGKWIIAFCRANNSILGKFNWQVFGSPYDKMDEDFAEIGRQVLSQEDQIDQEEELNLNKELIDEVFTLIDAINKNDPDQNYPSVEYVMPFVNIAVEKYFDASFKNFDFLKE